jgi:hypothetical protein
VVCFSHLGNFRHVVECEGILGCGRMVDGLVVWVGVCGSSGDAEVGVGVSVWVVSSVLSFELVASRRCVPVSGVLEGAIDGGTWNSVGWVGG